VAEPYSVDDFVEIGRVGLTIHTAKGPHTILVVPEPDGAILAVSGPEFAHDFRLPFEAWDRLLEAVADARLLARAPAPAFADTP
jgi:hypothetical protein